MKRQNYLPQILLASFIFFMLILPKSVQFFLKKTVSSLVPQAHQQVEEPRDELSMAEMTELVNRLLEEKVPSFEGVQASIVKRDPSYWDSLVWIDRGDVQKNSPVLYKSSLIGVVEEVFPKHALVRLITDQQLPVSVRVSRGLDEKRMLKQKVDEIIEYLSLQLLVKPNKEMESLYESLSKIDIQLPKDQQLLAKGIIHGRGSPMWRSYSYRLTGEGFNYDFADEEGPPLDLRTGIPYADMGKKKPNPIIQVGDTLVTTGLDALFPKGLLVGVVTKVYPLEEGATSYSIEAVSSAGSLHDIQKVTVIPPIGE